MKKSSNVQVGNAFRDQVKEIFEKQGKGTFTPEVTIKIGDPASGHRFDLANTDNSIVVECKNYTWTSAGNVPSAKLMGLDEAVFYFGFLPANTKKLLCMKRSEFPGKKETLAQYYVRMHGHLLRDVSVYEFSDNGDIRILREGAKK